MTQFIDGGGESLFYREKEAFPAGHSRTGQNLARVPHKGEEFVVPLGLNGRGGGHRFSRENPRRLPAPLALPGKGWAASRPPSERKNPSLCAPETSGFRSWKRTGRTSGGSSPRRGGTHRPSEKGPLIAGRRGPLMLKHPKI